MLPSGIRIWKKPRPLMAMSSGCSVVCRVPAVKIFWVPATRTPVPSCRPEGNWVSCTLGTGLALDLIQQVLELGPVTLEAGSGHVGQVVGNGGEHGVLGGQSGLAYPKCCVHVLSP